MWRGVWVPFCKIAIVSFLSVRYKSDGLYCRMADTPSSPTLFFYKTSKMLVRCMEHQDLVGEKDERGRPYLQMWRGVRVNCHSFLPIRRIQIERPILQDGRHTVITNSTFYKSIYPASIRVLARCPCIARNIKVHFYTPIQCANNFERWSLDEANPTVQRWQI